MTSLIPSLGPGICPPVSGGRADRATWRRQRVKGPGARVASVTNKPNLGRGGLGIDEGLLMIDDLGRGNGCRRRRAISTPSAPKKANLPRFWAENEGGVKNKANRRGPGPRLPIGDCRLGIRGRRMCGARVDGAPNKANLAGRDGQIQNPKIEARNRCKISMLDTSDGGRGSAIRDTRYQIRDTRPPCGRRAKQSQFAGRARQIRNPKLETRNKSKTPMPQTPEGRRVDKMTDKPNLARRDGQFGLLSGAVVVYVGEDAW
jgi:hypothetical protein